MRRVCSGAASAFDTAGTEDGLAVDSLASNACRQINSSEHELLCRCDDGRHRPRPLQPVDHDPQLLVFRPAPTPTGLDDRKAVRTPCTAHMTINRAVISGRASVPQERFRSKHTNAKSLGG